MARDTAEALALGLRLALVVGKGARVVLACHHEAGRLGGMGVLSMPLSGEVD